MDRIERIGQVAEIMRDYVENKKTFLTDTTKRVPVRLIPRMPVQST